MSKRGELTQQEQIRRARRAYIVTLNPAASRFAVYLDDGEGLDALWPHDSHLGNKSEELLEDQVYYKQSRGNLPAFHFHKTGYGFNKIFEVAEALRTVNPELDVMTLDGFNPSHSLTQ